MLKKFCQWMLSFIGWKIVGCLPDIKKYVLIAVPHTSNWDMPIGLLARFSLGTKIHFLAKKEIFVFPVKGMFKALGGIPVERSKSKSRVDMMVKTFQAHEQFILALAPEGTRSAVKRWKFGFYHIAHKADVPIVMVGFDYGKKEIIIREPFDTTGNLSQDYQIMVRFFQNIQGKYPKEIPPNID